MLIFLIYFFIYSFLGYICEVVFCSFGQRRLVNRGFLYLPICPIYGFGALMVIIFISHFSNFWFVVFVLGVVLTSLLEYLASYLLELFFKIRLWDYSNKKYNINGRVCLKNSILFGIMSLVLLYIAQPLISKLVIQIKSDTLLILGVILLVFMVIDLIFSIIKHINFSRFIGKLYDFVYNTWEIIYDKNEFENSKFVKSMRKLINNYPSIKIIKREKKYLKDILEKYKGLK